MYALRERRQHVTQEDFEFAVAKVRYYFFQSSVKRLAPTNTRYVQIGPEEESRGQHECQQAFQLAMICILTFQLYIFIYFGAIFLRTRACHQRK